MKTWPIEKLTIKSKPFVFMIYSCISPGHWKTNERIMQSQPMQGRGRKCGTHGAKRIVVPKMALLEVTKSAASNQRIR